ncbi:copper resistance CopC family protein [Spirillospora sp. NPDC029432]|uniref:copper resistance CopC family protein n=1 Tax=Spirillospora sp. NPDC029432 TaxID=3154599 RepID=UPI0034515AAE
MRFRRITLAIALVAAVLGLGAAPAWAHDALKSSNPEKGAEIVSPPEIELTFTGTVRVPQIVLTGPDGAKHGAGEARAVDNKVTQAVEGTLPNGEYTVGWRVVSSDGHPISGSFKFSVKGSPDSSASASASAAPAAPAPSATATTQAASQEESGSSSGWLWIGVAALVIVVIAGGVFWARRPGED